MSYHIASKDPKKNPCCCNTQSMLPSVLEKKIAEYDRLIEQTDAAREAFIQQALNLEDLAHESNATANKNQILAAIAEIAPSIEINPITTDQINALFPSES